nr:family 10 glycosylhydrolase [Paenibacillus larvae]
MNQLVKKDLSHEIKSAKTYVKFGISPFGVWRNKSSDPNERYKSAKQLRGPVCRYT